MAKSNLVINYINFCANFSEKLREGVYRDVERQAFQKEMQKSKNTYQLQQQKELEKVLRREQEAAGTWSEV